MAWPAETKAGIIALLTAGMGPEAISDKRAEAGIDSPPLGTMRRWASEAGLTTRRNEQTAPKNEQNEQPARPRRRARLPDRPLEPEAKRLARKAIYMRLRYLAGEDDDGNTIMAEMGSHKSKALAYEVRTLSEAMGVVIEVVEDDTKSTDSGVDSSRVLESMGIDLESGGEE